MSAIPLQAAKTPQSENKDRVPGGISASDWQSICAAHKAWQHAIEPVKSGWQARNPAQQWTTKFDGRGFEAKPHSAEWTWGLELRSYGVGDEQRAVKGTPEVKTEGHRLAYHWDETVQEWYVNDGRGLEHGFSVQERPPGPSDAPLTFLLATRGPLRPSITSDSRGVDYRDKSGATMLTYSGLRVWDADGRELEARFTPARDGVTLQVDAKNARYPLLIDPIAQQAYLKALNSEAGDSFGYSIAISDNTVVVGAPGEDSSTPGVNSPTPDNSASGAGAAYVFVRNGTTWTQQAYLKASNPGGLIPPVFGLGVSTPGDGFGASVAIDGNTVVVGAPGEGTSIGGVDPQANNSAPTSGAAYVFVRNGTTWTQQSFLKASNPQGGFANSTTFSFFRGDEFGTSVAISEDMVVVGAPGEDSNGLQDDNSAYDSGAAYLFVRSAGKWEQKHYAKASLPGGGTFPVGFNWGVPGDRFGQSVAVSQRLNAFMVGAPREDSSATGVGGAQNNDLASDSGAVYVFAPLGGFWTQRAYIKASNTGSYDEFGSSIAISGNTLLVGAPSEDGTNNAVSDSGAAYAFEFGNTGWGPQGYLKASNAGADDRFGKAVAISADVLVVGAFGEDSDAKGVNGQSNESLTDSGAAYVFLRSGSSWSQQAFVKASNAGKDDSFGMAVAISGDTVVVGASLEDSVNDSASDSGAAYVFAGFGPAPVMTSSTTAKGVLGVAFNFQATASAVAGVDNYGASGLPAGLSLNAATGAITGIPTAVGSFVVTVTAVNAGGTATSTLTLDFVAPFHFTGDNKNDVLWQNIGDGRLNVWEMNGLAKVSEVMIVGTVPDTGWRVMGSGDFTGDGKVDILWRHLGDGRVHVWEMNGTVRVRGHDLPTVGDKQWQIGGVGDMTGDGKVDIVWQHRGDGRVLVWAMNGLVGSGVVALPTVGDLWWQVASVGDMSGDGKADIVWQHRRDGRVHVWEMNGTTPVRGVDLPKVADLAWRIGMVGDMTGDGRNDLVWRHDVDGLVVVWEMNGTTLVRGHNLPAVVEGWQIGGTSEDRYEVKGDFTGNGWADILWQHRGNGQVHVWEMEGTKPAAGMDVARVGDLDWRIGGTGDMTGDGKVDIVWRNTKSGAVHVWAMNGAKVAAGIDLPIVADQNWQIGAVGDLTADGWEDILWRNTATGAVHVWTMEGTKWKAGINLPTVSDQSWQIAATGDMNGDGWVDIVWRNTATGAVHVWTMEGTTQKAGINLPTVADQRWQIGGTADYTGDGWLDILWRDTTTGAVQVWQMEKTTAKAVVNLPPVTDTNWRIFNR